MEHADEGKPENNEWDEVIAGLNNPDQSKHLDYAKNHFDTTNIKESPIKIISIDTTHENHALVNVKEYEVLKIRFQNNSPKTIDGLKMRWYCEDAFGEPALLLTLSPVLMSIGEAQSDDHVKPGQEGMVVWKGRYAKIKVVKAWPYKIAYADGTVWEMVKK